MPEQDPVTGRFVSSQGLAPSSRTETMPAKSAKQERFMQMMAHNPEKKKTKGMGPSPEVAKKFLSHSDYRGQKNGRRA